MSEIGVGSYVVCVFAGIYPEHAGTTWPYRESLVERAVYLVTGLWEDRVTKEMVVSLAGVPRVIASRILGYPVGFAVRRFKPLYGDTSLVTEEIDEPVKESLYV